jgi:D-sedoheptulose 7-phosphate isomerase
MVSRKTGLRSTVETSIKDGIDLHQKLLADFVPNVLELADLVLETFEQGGKLFFLGNGGSAAEAQHIATEFVVRFRNQRRALPVIALTTDTSVMTAIGNDFDFDQIFARQVEALMGPGDLLVALSTSGSSPNVLEAVKMAHQRGAKTVGFTGDRQGPLTKIVDVALEAPSGDTQRIQEAHLMLWHIICDLVETMVVEQEQASKK